MVTLDIQAGKQDISNNSARFVISPRNKRTKSLHLHKSTMKNVAVLLVVLIAVNCVTSRWLPTRDNTDRLDKLREMLKDILESEYEKTLYNKAAIFKREVGPLIDAPSTSANEKANEVHGGK
ncbi:UNVERIFIED_CONTAM: hypothetical protein PYX00_004503 [Menopon gallinae]|uniref:Uncharacterized protein n=1 Tax=Menopon gallinae TaxID=328185 RepID=A0AAW2I6M2_9NEOP